MTPKQYLNQGYRLNEIIETDKLELAQLRELADGLTSIWIEEDKISSGKVSSLVEENVLRIINLSEKINREIQAYLQIKEEIRDEIEKQIMSNTEKEILRLRYVLFFQWDDIFTQIHMERSQTFKLHQTALNHFKVPVKDRTKSD